MKVNWNQLHYGKLVEEPGGKIVHLHEHGRTGCSKNFPSALETLCRPSEVGFDDRFPWKNYHWLDKGGLVVTPVRVGGLPYIIAARIRGRSEDGEGKEGRFFTQAHYLVTLAREYHFGVIPQLDSLMKAEPMTRKDMDMPEVMTQTSYLVERLAPNELEEVFPVLEVIASGLPISIQNVEKPLSDFLELFTKCLACLPGTLSWRIPIGVGLYDMKGQIPLAQGTRAFTSYKILKGERRSSENESLAAGQFYVQWLKALIEANHCQTLDAIHKVVNQALPNFAEFDAIDPKVGWKEAIIKVTSAINEHKEFEAVTKWLEGGRGTPPEHRFQFMKTPFLELVLNHLDGRGSEFLVTVTGTDYQSAWRELQSSQRLSEAAMALGQLLNIFPLVNPSEVLKVNRVSLPPSLSAKAKSTLSNALKTSNDGNRWVQLAQSRPGEAKWLTEWRDENQSRLMALALKDLKAHNSNDLLNVLPETDDTRTLNRLYKNQNVAYEDLERLLDNLGSQDEDVRNLILNKVKDNRRYAEVCRLVEFCESQGLKTELGQYLNGPRLQYFKELTEFAVGLAEHMLKETDWNKTMVRVLLHGWDQVKLHLGNREVEHLQSLLNDKLGSPWAEALLDIGASQRSSDMSLIGAQLCRELMEDQRRAPKLQQSLVAPVCHQVAGFVEAVKLVSQSFQKQTRALVTGSHLVTALSALYSNQPVPNVDLLSSTDRENVRCFFQLAPVDLNLADLLEPQASEGQLEALLNLIPEGFPGLKPTFNPQNIRTLLIASHANEATAAKWKKLIQARSWGVREGWQLLTREDFQISDREARALDNLSGSIILKLALRRIVMHSHHYEKISIADFEQQNLSPVKVEALRVRALKVEGLRWALMAYLLEMLRAGGVSKNKVEDILPSSSWIKFSNPFSSEKQPENVLEMVESLFHGQERRKCEALLKEVYGY